MFQLHYTRRDVQGKKISWCWCFLLPPLSLAGFCFRYNYATIYLGAPAKSLMMNGFRMKITLGAGLPDLGRKEGGKRIFTWSQKECIRRN